MKFFKISFLNNHLFCTAKLQNNHIMSERIWKALAELNEQHDHVIYCSTY